MWGVGVSKYDQMLSIYILKWLLQEFSYVLLATPPFSKPKYLQSGFSLPFLFRKLNRFVKSL